MNQGNEYRKCKISLITTGNMSLRDNADIMFLAGLRNVGRFTP